MSETNSELILVIEDADALRKDIMEMLHFEGYSVIGAANGIAGIEKALRYRPDLIICDVIMPELDGYGVLIEIRKNSIIAATPFMFLTAKRDAENVREGMVLGADDYLPKPFTTNELIQAVRTQLEKHEIFKQALRNAKDHDVFLSYSRKDNQIMEQVRDSFIKADLKVWTDENLEPGTPEWEHAIVDALKYSASLAVILSPDAERSKWVLRELALAEMLAIRIFPILARGDERTSIPLRVAASQWIDIRTDYQPAFDKLLVALRKHLNLPA